MPKEKTRTDKKSDKEEMQSGKEIKLKIADSVITIDIPRIHIISHERGWAVQKEGAKRATGVWDTKEDAIDQGKKIAKASDSELVIHTKDGKIEASEII